MDNQKKLTIFISSDINYFTSITLSDSGSKHLDSVSSKNLQIVDGCWLRRIWNNRGIRFYTSRSSNIIYTIWSHNTIRCNWWLPSYHNRCGRGVICCHIYWSTWSYTVDYVNTYINNKITSAKMLMLKPTIKYLYRKLFDNTVIKYKGHCYSHRWTTKKNFRQKVRENKKKM